MASVVQLAVCQFSSPLPWRRLNQHRLRIRRPDSLRVPSTADAIFAEGLPLEAEITRTEPQWACVSARIALVPTSGQPTC